MKCHRLRHLERALTVLVGCGFLHGAFADTAAPPLSTDDYVAIQQLYARFNTALDTGQAQQFADTWTDDGEFVGGRGPGRGSEVRTPIKGRAELVAMGQRAGVGTRHFVTNLVVTPTVDGARASCYLVLLNARNSPPSITETAIYEDTLVKTAQGWKFRKRINWRDDDDISPYKPKPLTGPLP
jgi:SnoaL-like domain